MLSAANIVGVFHGATLAVSIRNTIGGNLEGLIADWANERCHFHECIMTSPNGSQVRVEQHKLTDVLPDPKNANKHKPRGASTVEKSLRQRGFFRPTAAFGKGVDKPVMGAGNLTQETALSIGMEDAIFVYTDGSRPIVHVRTDIEPGSKEAQALALEDNRAAELSLDWDVSVIADMTPEVIGDLWTPAELSDLGQQWADEQSRNAEDPGAQIDKAAELQAKWQTASGQMWQLGEHRLICGDCTDAATVARVMGGEKARLVFTSPPYADQREYQIGAFDWLALMNGASDCIFAVIGNPADVVVNLGMSYKDGRVNFYWNDWLAHCEKLGHPLFGWYVWDKGSGLPGEWNGRLAPAHEWLFHFSSGRKSANKWIETKQESRNRGAKGSHTFRQKDGSLNEATSPDKIGQPFKIPDSVVRVNKQSGPLGNGLDHPAVFSLDFAEFGIQTWSDSGTIAFEPFCGSGTTICACERLSRKCRAVEISPAYVAVALQRWADMTGKTPTLVQSNT